MIRNGWLNTFRRRDEIGYILRLVNSMFLRKRMCDFWIYRYDVDL